MMKGRLTMNPPYSKSRFLNRRCLLLKSAADPAPGAGVMPGARHSPTSGTRSNSSLPGVFSRKLVAGFHAVIETVLEDATEAVPGAADGCQFVP
jgi:hypothetical protein